VRALLTKLRSPVAFDHTSLWTGPDETQTSRSEHRAGMEFGPRAGWRTSSSYRPNFAPLGAHPMTGALASHKRTICNSSDCTTRKPPPTGSPKPAGVPDAFTMADGRSPYLTSVRRPAGRRLLQPPVLRAPAARRASLRQPVVAWVSPSPAITLLRLPAPSAVTAMCSPHTWHVVADKLSKRPSGRRLRQQAAQRDCQGRSISACAHHFVKDAPGGHAGPGTALCNAVALHAASRRQIWPAVCCGVMPCIVLCCRNSSCRCKEHVLTLTGCDRRAR